ncbi:MAG: DUF1566 domain-containing protein [Gammaproteobacteria bacterium]|nr:DUF1566 domain-containing protein [Gammaproteobacteria bacterium]MDH5582702.1 DUF1566 domain-containing protein [Gammaproteobacteria bacterium]
MKLSKSVLITISLLVPAMAGLAGLAQAEQPSKNRYVTLPPDQSGAIWVLDTTTSLRWQQEPSGTYVYGDGELCNGGGACGSDAFNYCAALGDGARVPEIRELISLDDFVGGRQNDKLNAPNGPFSNVLGDYYFSATNAANIGTWSVHFGSGDVVSSRPIGSAAPRAWCVR